MVGIGAIKFVWGIRPRDVHAIRRNLVLAVYLSGVLHHFFLPWLKDGREYVLAAMSYENGGSL